MQIVDEVYGYDNEQKAFDLTVALTTKYPDLAGIYAPTCPGLPAVARALESVNKGKGAIKLAGMCVPSITSKYMLDDTIQVFYLWDPIKLGYVTYYAAKYLADGKISGKPGDSFTIKEGKWPGTYTILPNGEIAPAGPSSTPRPITRSTSIRASEGGSAPGSAPLRASPGSGCAGGRPGGGSMSFPTPVIERRGITKRFGPVEVLTDIDLSVRLGSGAVAGGREWRGQEHPGQNPGGDPFAGRGRHPQGWRADHDPRGARRPPPRYRRHPSAPGSLPRPLGGGNIFVGRPPGRHGTVDWRRCVRRPDGSSPVSGSTSMSACRSSCSASPSGTPSRS